MSNTEGKAHKKRVLVFDLWGDFAHFKKAEATTSPLTHTIPTGTAIKGLIAAILGLDRDSYYSSFTNARMHLGIRILNPVKKITISQNIINTKHGYYLWDCGENPRSPTPYQFLKNVKYRIYLSLEDESLYMSLKNNLIRHKTVYTPYLGISELIGNFQYVGEFYVTPKHANNTSIHSIIRKDKVKINLDPIEGTYWIVERIPLSMSENRVVEEYAEVIFEANTKPLKISEGVYYSLNNENIVFL